MLKRLLPRQDNFFQLFQQASDTLLLASTEFANLLQHLDNQQYHVDRIAKHEELFGSAKGNRTPVTGMRILRPNR